MNRHHALAWLVLAAVLLAAGITPAAHAQPKQTVARTHASLSSRSSGVWYEIFVRSWYDTNGDGIGDLNGVTAKLDYLKSLGISGIWLMPINPSPSYHGYDVTNYYGINPQYGSMADFEHLLHEAHKCGIKVIMDLVINHTSSQSPWFKAAQNPHSRYHDWYTWAGPNTNLHAISAAGGPAWHAAIVSADGKPVAGSPYYLGVFGRNMPDLNYDDPAVRREMIKVGQFWLKKGVDGFRLDAARHIYDNLASDDGKPSTLRKNVAWWSDFRHGLDVVNRHAYLVGEVTVPPAAAAHPDALLAPYLKPLDSVFDFPLAAELIASAQQEKVLPIAASVARSRAAYRAASAGHFIDATFLSNHDQNRVLSQLDGNLQHMRMAAAMLLTLPGRPFIYYGEELGMLGHKPDPDLREPMRWDRSRDAPGETRWKVSSARQGGDISVAAEQTTPDSLLKFYRMLIRWRSQLPALRDGRIHPFPLAGEQLMAYRLDDARSHLLVVHNLSGRPQRVKLLAGSFRRVIRRTRKDVEMHGHLLSLPPYSTAIVQ
ncbi:MAG: DUF3459 domain-containing protein [Rhodanobacter sp.]|nr:MAG: DUF3459 domain-containing protein [Rhodanobacter sp.]